MNYKVLIILIIFLIWMIFFDTNSLITHFIIDKEIIKMESEKKYIKKKIALKKQLFNKICN